MWVAEDGSYGSGQVEKFDVSKWTDDDFEAVEEASDSTRLYVAQQIDQSRRGE